MVRPKSRTSVSRRSSILKAAVVQQPMQHVTTNVSLHQESLVTIKQKRRVSFADKKHVKEFCDSVEQGTVWDSTYEESSSENSGQINLNNQSHNTINNDHQDINDGRVRSENVNIINNSLDLTEPINTMGSFKPISVEEISTKKSTPTLCQSTGKKKDNHSILIESNANIGISADKSKVVYNDTSSLNDTENAELNKTCDQDVSMEITEIPYVIKSRNIVPMTHEQLLEDKENIPMSNIINKSNVLSILQNKMNKVSAETQYVCTEQLEFTECLQSVTNLAELQAKLSKVTPIVNDEELYNQKTQIFQDVPMEITCAIPLKDKENCIDQTINFHNTPMDSIMAVTSTTNEKEITTPIDTFEIESNRTTLLNTSMEITNKICSSPHPKTVDTTTDPIDILNYRHSSVHYNKDAQLNNDTMEFTIAVTNLPPITELDKCAILGQIRLSSENTQTFQNESMEITEALHIPKILHNNDVRQLNDVTVNPLMNNEGLMSFETQIFLNESMEITEALHIPKILHNNDIQKLNDDPLNPLMINEDLISSKTQMFYDESMAITAPLHTPYVLHNNDIQQLYDVPINPLRNNEDVTSINTRIFQNMSMEITNAIANSPILSNSGKLCESTEEDYVNLNINGKVDKTIVNNKASGIVNDTADFCTTNCIEGFENSSTELKPVNALTSLISSFVYADMIEDDSFVKAMNENELQSMKNSIEQEINNKQNNIKTKFVVDSVNLEVENLQYSDKCIARDKEIIREHESYIEYHHEDNNIQEENVKINREENNTCNPKQFLSKSIKINEDVFEKSINHKTMCDSSTEIEIIRRNKQLNETMKDIQRNSATYIIKPKNNSVMDIDKYTDECNSSNQISDRSPILSPTLLSASNKSKMSVTENHLIANLTGNINLNDFYEKENCNNSSLNEDVEHVTPHKKLEESSTFQKGIFFSLVHQLKMYMGSNDCIWDLYHEDIDKQMLVVSFISASLLIVIFIQNDVNTATRPIKRIVIISRLENNENVQLSIAHKLIKEKINVKYVNQLHKYDEDVVPLLTHISEDVKLVLDFIFDLKQLDDTNLMEINTERITFITRSKYMNIVLEVTMDVELFDKIDSSNINIVCILGTVRKEDIKELIIDIKRDHKFLRRFMSHIKVYIDIMEQADLANEKSCS